jgi:ABC-type multidrug transport system ATPase subunit
VRVRRPDPDGGRGLYAQGLEKAFDGRPVLRDLDLSLQPGCIGVIEGADGAGKTTLLRILATVVWPDAGDAWVDGFHVRAHAPRVRERVGVAFVGERSLFWRLTGVENLRLFARTRGVAGAEVPRRIGELLDEFGMREVATRRVADVSAGQRQRLILMRAALGDPSVFLLDEPLRGLDEAGLDAVIGFLARRADAGATILVATPSSGELEGLDAYRMRIDDGRLVAETAEVA